MTKPFRFGVQIVPQNTTWPEIRDAARLVESVGFDTAWTFDHFYPIFTDPAGPCLEGWITLAALARETSRIELGTLVTGATYRHPAVVANMVATLDHVSDGRAILGIGAGWFEMEHAGYGIAFPPVGERIERLDEACEVISRLLTSTTSDYQGRFYRLEAARCEPKCVRQPRVPIMIGGGGEKKTLPVVARHADLWNWFGTVESFRHKLGILKTRCDEIGRPFESIEASWLGTLQVTASSQERDRRLEALARRRNESREVAAAASLVGSPDEIEARIRDYASVGVTHFIMSAMAPFDLAGLRRFGEEVMPRFR